MCHLYHHNHEDKLMLTDEVICYKELGNQFHKRLYQWRGDQTHGYVADNY